MALLNGALKVLNTGVGSIITQVVLFGGAIWGLVSKLTVAGGIIPPIVSQFKMFGTIMSGGVSAGIAAAGTGATAFTAIMGSMLPIILAVTAAIALLAAGFKAFKDAQYKKSYEGIKEEIGKTDTELQKAEAELERYTSKQEELTEAEREYAEALRQTVQGLRDKKAAQEGEALDAKKAEVQKALEGVRVSGADELGFGFTTETYNKEKKAFNDLIKMVKNGQRETDKYKDSLKSFIATNGDYVNSLVLAGMSMEQIDAEFDGLATDVQTAKNELEDLGKKNKDSVEPADRHKEAVDRMRSKLNELSEATGRAEKAIQKFNDATSYDYSKAIKSYQQIAQALGEKMTEGTINRDEIIAGAKLYFGEDYMKTVGYSVERASQDLGKLFSGEFGQVMKAEDPLKGLSELMQSKGGELRTEAGELVASLDGSKLTVESWALLAEYFGVDTTAAEAFGVAIQGITGKTVFTTEQIQSLGQELDNTFGTKITASIAQTSDGIGTLASQVAKLTGETDPTKVREYVEALLQANGIEITPEVTTNIDKGMEQLEVLEKKAKEEETKKVTIEMMANETEEYKQAKSDYDNTTDKTVTTTFDAKVDEDSLNKAKEQMQSAVGGGSSIGDDVAAGAIAGEFGLGGGGIGGGNKITAEISTEFDSAGIDEANEQIGELKAQLEEPLEMGTHVDIEEVMTAQEQVEILQNMEDPQKTVYVDYSEAIAGMAAWQAILDSPSETHKFEYIHIIQIVTTIHHAKGARSTPDETAMVNDGTPINGSSAEIIQQNGRMYIAGQGNLTAEHLERGARVYNAADTQAILRKNNLKEEDLYGEGIPAFASGGFYSGNLPVAQYNKYYGGGYEDDSPARWGHGEENVIDLPTPAIADKVFPNSKWSYATKPNSEIATFRDWIETVGFTEENLKDTMEQALQQGKNLLKSGDITEEEYFRGFYYMNEAAYKFRDKQAKTYQKYAQKIYDWEHGQIKELVDLEEKLADLEEARAQRMTVYSGGKYGYTANIENIAKAQRDADQALAKKWDAYANGTTGASGGMALVGEHGPELRVLGGGDGILPAQATRNLMRMANVGDFTGKAGGTTNIFNVDNVELPSVTNAQEFVDGLKNLAIQKAMAR